MTQQPNNVSAAGVLSDDQWDAARLDAAIQDFATVVIMAQKPDHGGMRRELKQARERIHEIARSLAAASAHAPAQAVAIYQVKVGNAWVDSNPAEYAAVSNEKRIVYAAPSPAAREAGGGVRLTDAEIKTLVRKVEDELNIVWFVPDDSERHLWRTITTDERDRFVRALLREAGSRS